jgi:hypothetical protein
MTREDVMRRDLDNKFDTAIKEIIHSARANPTKDNFALSDMLSEIIRMLSAKSSAKEVKTAIDELRAKVDGDSADILDKLAPLFSEYIFTYDDSDPSAADHVANGGLAFKIVDRD